ncbi:hypothetical protein GPALN_002214 [Globodera pallida]|nr:hypothetical protein GPALN_002214 [Globodera pallida]
MHKLLGLLLGAAVQSPQREHFIERIKRMRPEVQSELAEEIQRVTSGAGASNSPVLNLDMLLAELEDGRVASVDEDGAVPATQHQQQQQQHIVAMLERALRERDEYANGMLEMAQEMDHDENGGGGGSSSALTTCSSSCNGDIGPASGGKTCKQHNGATFDGRSPSPNAHDRHANVELAAAKAELRKLRNENDEKEEMLLELQDELERQRAEIGRLQAERLELVKDARAAKDLRDEMDCMQHKLSRLERLETDAEKMRTKLGELDFYRSRVNNLKEDNRLMQETCRVMEEQLEQCQRKLSAHLEVETKLIESQANNKSLQLDLTKTRAHVEDLLIENGRLERELKANVQRHAELERAMQHCNVADEAHAASSPRGDTLHDASLLAQLDAYNHKLKARLSSGESVPNPAEMFELKAELNAHEKLAEEKITECQHLRANLELGRKEVREAEEREHELRAEIDKMERQLADQRRTTVSIQTHQLVVERLESTERKSQELEQRVAAQLAALQSEKCEAEVQLQRLCVQQRDNRAELDALRERAACDADQWDRQRKVLETERNALRTRLDAAEEASVREMHAAQCTTEHAARYAADSERQLREQEERVRKLETELAQQRQQTDAECKKAQRFREDLNIEQNRLSDLLARLRSVCLMALRTDVDEADKSCLESNCLQDDLQLIAIIDDLLMKALSDARREADALRVQQQKQIRELDDLKRDIQSLRKTGHELNASDDQLLVENRNIKEQVILLQEGLQRAQNEESTRTAELQAAKREIDELQQKAFAHSRTAAELVNAQLSIRNRQLQEDQLRGEQSNLRVQLEAALKCSTDTQKRLDSLELIHSALASDHDRLQNLHQMLSSDYDRIKREKEVLRQKMKGEKMTIEQILRAEFTRERNQLEQALEEERVERQREMRRVAELEAEMASLDKELVELKRERSSTMFRNAADSADELRRLRMSECAQKSSINSLNVIIQQLNNALTEKDLELGNLRRQVEMLRQYNGEENRTLIKQIELLLIQNQQLHNRSDAFYAEQKELQEKLMTLRRHKEKLEEKIMEQYKQMDSRKSTERPTFMKRAAKLISKSPSRKPKELSVTTANSASDRSEDSSIYSTDELTTTTTPTSRNTTALANSPPPPPPCPTTAPMATQMPVPGQLRDNCQSGVGQFANGGGGGNNSRGIYANCTTNGGRGTATAGLSTKSLASSSTLNNNQHPPPPIPPHYPIVNTTTNMALLPPVAVMSLSSSSSSSSSPNSTTRTRSSTTIPDNIMPPPPLPPSLVQRQRRQHSTDDCSSGSGGSLEKPASVVQRFFSRTTLLRRSTPVGSRVPPTAERKNSLISASRRRIPPPPTPMTAKVQQSVHKQQHFRDATARRSTSGTRCSTSLYSSINSVYSNQHQKASCLGACSIERCVASGAVAEHPLPHIRHPLNALRARNGRLGGSLRSPPAALIRSFPAPTGHGFIRPQQQQKQQQLPACCKVMQKDVGIAEERDVMMIFGPSAQSPPSSTVQPPKIIHRAELPPKMPSTTTAPQQQLIRPPPPPYPGMATTKMGTGALRGSPSSISTSSCRSLPPSPYLGGGRTNINCQQHFPNPRDTSTPKSTNSSPSSNLCNNSSSSKPFSLSNCLGNVKYSTHAGAAECSTQSSSCSTACLREANVNLCCGGATLVEEGQMRECVRDPAERTEKAASVYENVAEKRDIEAVSATAEDAHEQQHGAAVGRDGGERREGPKGEIWYEFGCV